MSDAYDELFQRYGAANDIDWQQLKAQVAAESDFDPHAISDAGAKGLAQFLDSTFNEWAGKLGFRHPDPFNPEQSIAAQASYMSWLMGKTGDWLKALAAYNWGIGHIQKLLDDPDWMNHVPAETREYISRIQRHLNS